MTYLTKHKFNLNNDIVLELLNEENVSIKCRKGNDSYHYYCECEHQSEKVKNKFDELLRKPNEDVYCEQSQPELDQPINSSDGIYCDPVIPVIDNINIEQLRSDLLFHTIEHSPSMISELQGIPIEIKNRRLITYDDNTLLSSYLDFSKECDVTIVSLLITPENLNYVTKYDDIPLHLYCSHEYNNDINIIKLLKTFENLKTQAGYKNLTPLMSYLKSHRFNINNEILLELLNIDSLELKDNNMKDSYYYYCKCEHQSDMIRNAFQSLRLELKSKCNIQRNNKDFRYRQYSQPRPQLTSCCIIS